MENMTEQILKDYARQQKPSWREAYLNDVMMHAQITSTRNTLNAVERALKAEGVAEEVIFRVLRRVIIGDPHEPPGEQG